MFNFMTREYLDLFAFSLCAIVVLETLIVIMNLKTINKLKKYRSIDQKILHTETQFANCIQSTVDDKELRFFDYNGKLITRATMDKKNQLLILSPRGEILCNLTKEELNYYLEQLRNSNVEESTKE